PTHCSKAILPDAGFRSGRAVLPAGGRGGRAARKPTGGPTGDILADPAYSFAPLRQRGRRSFAQPRTNWPAPLQGTPSMQVAGNFPVHIIVPALTRFPDA